MFVPMATQFGLCPLNCSLAFRQEIESSIDRRRNSWEVKEREGWSGGTESCKEGRKTAFGFCLFFFLFQHRLNRCVTNEIKAE